MRPDGPERSRGPQAVAGRQRVAGEKGFRGKHLAALGLEIEQIEHPGAGGDAHRVVARERKDGARSLVGISTAHPRTMQNHPAARTEREGMGPRVQGADLIVEGAGRTRPRRARGGK